MANASRPPLPLSASPRPTREPLAPLRPTHDPRPASKPYATWRTNVERIDHVERTSGELVESSARSRPVATIVARFPATIGDGQLAALLPSLAARALDVRRLETVASEIPATMGDAVRRVLHKAAIVAAAFGAVGALAGALAFEGEALLPSLGWTPGPLVGAALGGGLFGALGFLVGAIAMLFVPSLALDRAHDHGTFVILRARAFDLEALVAHVVAAGGSIAALGEG